MAATLRQDFLGDVLPHRPGRLHRLLLPAAHHRRKRQHVRVVDHVHVLDGLPGRLPRYAASDFIAF